MRIRKVSQTTPVSAEIVDGYSASTSDAYSCNYINENIVSGGEALPVGSEIDYDGSTVPAGWELVADAGGIVDGGSNINGRYIKFSDGTMICYLTTKVNNIAIDQSYGSFYLGTYVWTFPAEFLHLPVVSCGCFLWGSSGSWGQAMAPSLTQITLRGYDILSRASGTDVVIQAIAIGRWQ